MHQAGFGNVKRFFRHQCIKVLPEYSGQQFRMSDVFFHARVGPVLFKMPGVFQLGVHADKTPS